MAKKEPEVVVFQEPSYSRKPSREAAKEKEMFLVSPMMDIVTCLSSSLSCFPQQGDISDVFSAVKRDSTVKTKAQPSSSEFDLKATLREVQSLGGYMLFSLVCNIIH